MEKIYKAAIYLRLSRDDEHAGESCSISNQRQLLENFVDGKNDIEIVKEYVDDGFSGYDFNRPGFRSMIADINEGVIDCVIVKDLSRLGRNFQRTEEYIQRFFPNKNVRFIAVSDCFDSTKETSITDLLAYPVKNLINEYHVMETSLKIRNVFEHYRQTGKLFIGNTPFGYVIKDKKIVVDEEAAAVVRMIFDMKINGSSNQGIADILNENGVKSPLEYRISKGYADSGSHFKKDENAVWQSMSVKRILENPIYIGTLIQGKTTSASYKDRRRHDRDGYAHDPNDYHRLIIVEKEAAIIREIFERVAAGEKYNDVRLDLNERKILDPPWSVERMRKTLKNENYKGTLVLRRSMQSLYKGEKKKYIPSDQQLRFENSDRVPVIVPPEIWQKARDTIKSRSKRAAKDPSSQTSDST